MNYKIAQLEIESTNKKGNVQLISVSNPNPEQEILAGRLFIILNIENNDKFSKRASSYITETINDSYYNNNKIVLKKNISSLKIEHIFEDSISLANKKIAIFLKNNKKGNFLEDINITAGIVCNNKIHFTNTGKNKILLIHKNNKQHDSEYILTKVLSTETAPQNNKLFSDILSGSFPKQGVFMFVSENLTEYISNKQLISINSTLPPISAAEQIKNTLSKVNKYVSFSALIIKNSSSENKPKNTLNIKTEYNLQETEKSTEQLLSPSGILSSKNWLPKKKTNKQEIKEKIFSKKRVSFLEKKILQIFKSVFSVLGNLVQSIIQKSKFFNNLKNSIHKPTPNSIKLKTKSPWLILVSVIFIILLGLSISLTSTQKEQKISKNEQNKIIIQIQKKLDQADSSMLYSNEKKTKELVDEIKLLIANLINTEDKNVQAKIAGYNKKLNGITNELQHVISMDSGTTISNFSKINSNASIDNITFNSYNNTIYASDSSQSSIYTINIKDKTTTSILDLKISFENLSKSTLFKNSNIYYLNTNNVIELNTNKNELNTIEIDLPKLINDNYALSSYNDRLYLIDSENKQIKRYTFSNGDFSKPQYWLNKKINLDNTVDIEIDGFIYILKNNGEILKFLKGNQKEFKLDTIEPMLNSANKLFIKDEFNFIFILDKNNNRIVKFSKKGTFINQYMATSKINDFTIDIKNNILYILTNNQLKEFKL